MTAGSRLALLAACLAAVATAAAAAPGALAAPTIVTFSYTGSAQNWTVPAGVWSVSFDVFGGQGADAASGSILARGGLGGEATGDVAVMPGETLQIDVGGAGQASPAAGGFTNGSGGGGGSDVRLSPFGLGDRLIVGGGGGGSGGDDAFGDAGGDGGAGGGGDGSPGAASPPTLPTVPGTTATITPAAAPQGGGGGAGATGAAGGGGGAGADGGQAGQPGGLFGGGSGGATGRGVPSAGGINGGGGGGVAAGQTGGGGGGGGGGLFGGGGGGSAGGQTASEGGGGGGGGSSSGPSAAVLRPGVRTGDGLVTVAFTPSRLPLATQVSPAAIGLGETFTDTATLGAPPPGAPPPTGSITFSVYGAGDQSCTGTPVFTSTNPLDASGTTSVSDPFRPMAAGTYRVIASYGGDADYLPTNSGCADRGGTVSVAPAPAPAVDAVSPNSGPEAGGTKVTVSGSKLGSASAVDFGGVPASQVSVNAAGTTITAVSPPGTGVVAVTVVTPGGRSPLVEADRFAFLSATPAVISGVAPSSGSTAGGNGVAVMGAGFTGATRISFGQTPGTLVSVDDSGTLLTALAPAGTGNVDIRIATPAGTSAVTPADAYAYVPPPPPPPPAPAPAPSPVVSGQSPPPAPGSTPTLPANTPAPPTSITRSPKVTGSSGARFAATIDPEGLATTMHFEYAIDPAGASAAAFGYTARTAEQPVGSDFADHTVTATVAGLVPSSVYRVRAVATNSAGVTAGAGAAFATAKPRRPPPPVLGRRFNAEPVSGRIRFFLPGHRRVTRPLDQAVSLPVGTIIDATHGTVRLSTATATKGRFQSGDFGGGRFRVLQSPRQRGLTVLVLIDPTGVSRICQATTAQARQAARRALPKAALALLRATVKGSFETHGHYSSATVRGTAWTTSDRCDGTFTAVRRGVVLVNDFRRHRLILLRAGHSYLAKAP